MLKALQVCLLMEISSCSRLAFKLNHCKMTPFTHYTTRCLFMLSCELCGVFSLLKQTFSFAFRNIFYRYPFVQESSKSPSKAPSPAEVVRYCNINVFLCCVMNDCPYYNAAVLTCFFFLRRILGEISVYCKLKYKRKMVCYYLSLPSPWMFFIHSFYCQTSNS